MAFAEGFSVGADIRDRRDAAREAAKVRNQELTKMGYSFDEKGNMSVREGSGADVLELQMQEQSQLLRSVQGKLAAQATDGAFEEYSRTGDATYLQKALDSDPMLKQAWDQRGVRMVNNIDFDNDSNMLAQAGLKPTAYDTDEKKDIIRKNMYKVYDGKSWGLGLANDAVMQTGTLSRLGPRKGEPLIQNFEAFNSLLKGPKSNPYTAEGNKYEKEINAAAEKYDLPANLIATMMHTESAGNSKAVSEKGARGLMQLMEGTAKEMGVTDINDAGQNIMGGAKYMRQMIDKYGDLETALAAYNAGPGNVDKHGGVPPFAETQNYVKKIMGAIDEAESFYGGDSKKMAERYKKAQTTEDIILDSQRARANASAGKTNRQVDEEHINDITSTIRGQDQKDIELTQNEKALALEAEGLDVKRQEIIAKLKTDGSTAEQKNLAAGADRIVQLTDKFGGEDAFFSTDFSDPKKQRDAMPLVNEIEQLTNQIPSQATLEDITEIRQLISLADPASQLTAAQTGIIDKPLNDVKKTIFDNLSDTEATSAYAALQNTLRNALYGSALTASEIDAFNSAFGKLGQGKGAVLQQFNTALTQIQARIDSISANQNPYTAKVRLGADIEKMQNIRNSLQERIDLMNGITPQAKAERQNKVEAAKDMF